MYWPNGVPRVYAVNGPGIPSALSEEDGVIDHENVAEQKGSVDRADEGSGSKPSLWADEPINGLCVSRSGHLFATMTESSIAIWQTKVCECSSALSGV